MNGSAVKKIGTVLFSVVATPVTFLFIACYVKAQTGGSWRVPLIVAGVITAVGLCVAYWAHSRRIGNE